MDNELFNQVPMGNMDKMCAAARLGKKAMRPAWIVGKIHGIWMFMIEILEPKN